ncbi:hypothetical protein M1146_05915 [Patescibacteria group bacterium]|nr:hypothetical protein [Patescibacteria group bacterium]
MADKVSDHPLTPESIAALAASFSGKSTVKLQRHNMPRGINPLDETNEFGLDLKALEIDPAWLAARAEDFRRVDKLPWLKPNEARAKEQEFSQQGDRTPAQILLARLEPLLVLKKEHESLHAKAAGYKLEVGLKTTNAFLGKFKHNSPETMSPVMDRTSFIVLENRANQLGLSFMTLDHEYLPPKK